ncbi:MAG: helix-hairpin-helix domain-containing protein, partial [Myxococcota bacterium]
MRNAEYAAILQATAALLEISGGNVYRVRAFERAARALKRHPADINPSIADGSITSLSGIGKSIAHDLKTLQEEGNYPLFEELRAELPEHILDLLQVQGLGPKKIKALYQNLAVGNLDDLERVIDSGEVAALKGFGQKTQDNIRREIERLRRQAGRVPLPQAMSIAAPLLRTLRAIPAVERVELAGSARRWRETVKDIDFVAASTDPEAVMEAFANLPEVTEVIARGTTKTSVFLPGDLQADLRVVAPDRFGSALHHFTGSKEHHVELRARAKAMGLKISEYGVFKVDDDSQPVASTTEEEVYAALGLPFIPPEMREASGELKAAEHNTLPSLVVLDDIRGDLHMHTTASDGKHSIEAMAKAAAARGYD